MAQPVLYSGAYKVLQNYNRSLVSLAYVPEERVQPYYQIILDTDLVEVLDEIKTLTGYCIEDDENIDEMECDDDGDVVPPVRGKILKENIDRFLGYWEANYVGSRTRTGWTQPKFRIEIWNLYHSAM